MLSIVVLNLLVVIIAFMSVSLYRTHNTPGFGAASLVLEQDVMVSMRDGVHLATDIYRPNKPGTFPVLLCRTPYDKTEVRNPTPKNLRSEKVNITSITISVEHDFVVVFQDCRGRFRSEGVFSKYIGEGADGFDTVEWILQQPWSNGQIGTFGLSYLAHCQMALACLSPPGLSTMVVDSGGFSNSYQGGTRQGGTFELKQLTWAWNHVRDAAARAGNQTLVAILDAVNITEWFSPSKMPWKRGANPLSNVPEYEAYVLEQWQNGNWGPEWEQVGIYAAGYYNEVPDVPQLHISGWYDVYTRTVTENFVGLKNKTQFLRLVIGPWKHGDYHLRAIGDVDFGEQAMLRNSLAPNYTALTQIWMNYHLHGIEPSPETFWKHYPVYIFVMGGGTGRKLENGKLDHGGAWRGEADWPLPSTVLTPFKLSTNGLLTLDTPEEGEVSFDYDPQNPVPSIGGTITSGAPIMEGGPFNQVADGRFFPFTPPFGPLESRSDVLVFMTPILTQDVEVTGEIKAILYVSSNQTDTDFTIKLVDVYPPNEDYPQGFAMNIQDGILRMRYRDNMWANPQLMTPETIYQITVSTFPTSNLFKAGHRIRLDISSSNYPHFDLNFNTGEPEGLATTSLVARNTIYFGPLHPSHLLLPVIPQ